MKTLQKSLLALATFIFGCANAHATMFWVRPYDPNLQRWLARDSIGEVGGINLYQFVGNCARTRWRNLLTSEASFRPLLPFPVTMCRIVP
jgi:hypothetical protein